MKIVLAFLFLVSTLAALGFLAAGVLDVIPWLGGGLGFLLSALVSDSTYRRFLLYKDAER